METALQEEDKKDDNKKNNNYEQVERERKKNFIEMWCPPRRDGLGGIFVCRVSNFPIYLSHTRGCSSWEDTKLMMSISMWKLYYVKVNIIIVIIRKGDSPPLSIVHWWIDR